MNELARLFSGIGIKDEDDIRMAVMSFIDEYNVSFRRKDNAIWRVIHSLRKKGLFDNLFPTKQIPWQTLLNASGLFQIPVSYSISVGVSILDKLGRMVILNEDIRAFNHVNDYARIAAHVYGNRKDSILSEQWTHLGNRFQNIRLDDEKCGLQAALYRKKSAVPHYVYAIAGTKGGDIRDWKANTGQLIGKSNQYDRVCEIAEKLSSLLGTSKLVMVGHSKGGGQAAYCALRTGCEAITFNPAGLGLYKFKRNKVIKPKINSYVMVKDPLNLMQILAQLVNVDITADGSVHYLKNDKNSPMSEWHGIDGFLRLGGLTDMHRLENDNLIE